MMEHGAIYKWLKANGVRALKGRRTESTIKQLASFGKAYTNDMDGAKCNNLTKILESLRELSQPNALKLTVKGSRWMTSSHSWMP